MAGWPLVRQRRGWAGSSRCLVDRAVRATSRERRDVVLRELGEERLARPSTPGTSLGRRVVGVEVVDRAAHRAPGRRLPGREGASARATAGRCRCRRTRASAAWPAAARSRPVFHARSSLTGVAQSKARAGRQGREVRTPVVVGVVARAVRPAAVERLVWRGLPLDVAHRAAARVGAAGVGAVVAPRSRRPSSGSTSMRNGLRTPMTKISGRVLARARLRRGCPPGSCRLPSSSDVDAQDLAAQVVGVAGAAALVEARVVAGRVVDRRRSRWRPGADAGVLSPVDEVEVALARRSRRHRRRGSTGRGCVSTLMISCSLARSSLSSRRPT